MSFCSLVNSTISDSDELEVISLSSATKKSLFLIDNILSINPFRISSTVAISFEICFKYPKIRSFLLYLSQHKLSVIEIQYLSQLCLKQESRYYSSFFQPNWFSHSNYVDFLIRQINFN